MKLIIAEKPSVCRDLSHAIGANSPVGNNYGVQCYQNDEYYVTSALGHLYNLGTPVDYGYNEKNWTIDELPMFPDFKIVKGTSNDERYSATLNNHRMLIKELMDNNNVTEIVCATDAGREGELIFRYIYNANGCTKPVKRLWISSLTNDSIIEGMKNLNDGNDYDNLYTAGITRAKADWLIGMNLSRLYSLLDNSRHRVGRVKTPVLNMVVQRDKTIKSFVKVPFFKVILDNGAECTKTYDTKAEAISVMDSCKGKPVTVTSAEKKEKSENRPLLFSLTSLQQEANDKLSLTAAETLTAAQSLYEKKLTTYPRTDSKYLTEDMRPVIEKTVKSLAFTDTERVSALLAEGLTIDNRIIDNSKVSDHHAIIPTTQIKKMNDIELNDNEYKVLQLIINRFLSAVDKPYVYVETSYIFISGEHEFSLKGKSPVNLGWKKYNKSDKDDIPVSEYSENDRFIAENVIVKDCEKQPLPHFTDSTILSAMENIDNITDDKVLREYVKGKGIGTPATRASIIEEIIQAKYIERKGKNIVATDFGIEFIDSLPESVKSAERTAEWEQILDNISNGDGGDTELLESIMKFVSLVIETEKNSERKPMQNSNNNYVREIVGTCPRCQKNIYEGQKNFYCESGKDGCGFTIFKECNLFAEKISSSHVKKFLSGSAVKLKSQSRDGKVYTAEYELNDDGGKYVNFKRKPNEKVLVGKCPKCSKNVYEGTKNFYCEDKACGFMLWKESFNRSFKVTAKHMKDLLSSRKAADFSIKNVDGGTILERYEFTEKDNNFVLQRVK